MKSGPALVISGTLISGVLLSLLLFTISAGAAYPSSSPHLAGPVEPDRSAGSLEDRTAIESEAREDPPNSQAECQLSHRFPSSILQWCVLITHYAGKRGLSPDLLAALIWQESGGDPLVTSRSGAVGLMQVMPSDGLATGFVCANGPCFGSRPSTAQLQDPEFNIAYGTRMLAGLLKREGSLREALKSYGPMDVGYSYADKVVGIFQRYGNKSKGP
jgi:soluble lytic murein transglycosylase-like protein